MKLLLFDLDGTILDTGSKITSDAYHALLEAKENGHQILIASGRTKGGLPRGIHRLPWDGYILGNGTYVEFKNEIVASELMDDEDVSAFAEYTKKIPGFALVLDTTNGSYVTEESKDVIMRVFSDSKIFTNKSKEEIFKEFHTTDDLTSITGTYKMMYFSEDSGSEQMIQCFLDIFDFIPNSILLKEDIRNGEVLKKGITKATGIDRLLEHTKYDRSDVVAFGDGHNDIEMISCAGCGIAMGNGVDALKEAADFVTSTQAENGISEALKYLNIIG